MSDFVVGARLQLDGADGIKTMREFKQQIKEAQGDLLAMSQEFGETSEQARMAAKRVAELQDSLGDAKNLVEAFNPDKKFVALGQALNGVLGGFTALTGAMGLLGVESEEVQKQLLKVQSALALSQGLNQIGDSINSFKTLGKTIVNTLGKSGAIGLAIAGVTALGLALAGVFDRRKDEALEAYKTSLKDFTRAAGDARANVAEMSQQLALAKDGFLSKDQVLKNFNATFGETLGTAESINDAERILNENAEAFIKNTGLKAQAQALYAKAAQDTAEILVKQQAIQEADIPTNVKEAALEKLRQQLSSADRINKMADDLLRQSVQVGGSLTSLGGSVGGGAKKGTGKATTPAGIQKEKEVEEVGALTQMMNQIERDEFEEKNRLRDLNEAGQAASLERQLANSQMYTQNEEALALARIEFAERESQQKAAAAQQYANTLMVLSDLAGKETAAGKVLAIASATINTYLAASKALAGDYSGYGPAGPFVRVATVISTIALGLKQVKEIMKVSVPGGKGGGGSVNTAGLSGFQAGAPLQPQSPLASRTRLEQDQINQIGNATVRAFVVESDVTNNQERIRRLNRAARI